MTELTARQEAFARHFVRCGNASQAARAAGYAPRSAKVAGCRLLTNSNLQAEIHRLRRQYEQAMGISREKVIEELVAAVDLAQAQGDARSMIGGWREIGRICGYYAPEKEVQVHVNVAAQRLIEKYETMSDTELMAILEASAGRP